MLETEIPKVPDVDGTKSRKAKSDDGYRPENIYDNVIVPLFNIFFKSSHVKRALDHNVEFTPATDPEACDADKEQ